MWWHWFILFAMAVLVARNIELLSSSDVKSNRWLLWLSLVFGTLAFALDVFNLVSYYTS
jgi:hypothetical protein